MEDKAMTQTEHSGNNNSSMTSFTRTLNVHAPPHEVYRAVTTVPGIQGWWSNKTVANNDDITVGFDGENFQTLRLVDLTPDKNVVWEWIAQYFPVAGTDETDEWLGTRVSFDIQATPDGSSTLVFTHNGLTPQLVCYGQCNAGWNRFLESLKLYLERGAGTPYVSNYRQSLA